MTNAQNTSVNTLVGTDTFSQIGNVGDSHGYQESAPVKVLAHSNRIAGDVYLIDTGTCYGIATLKRVKEGYIPKTPLYCTVALPYRYSKSIQVNTLGFDISYFDKAAD